jgi:tetratricopeptide (TPR) repeat protein
LKFYEKTLIIRLKHLPNGHCNIGDIYNNIGAVYRSLYHYDLALDYFSRSIEIYNKSLCSSHPSVASTCKNIGMTYEIKKDFIQALEFYIQKQQICFIKH